MAENEKQKLIDCFMGLNTPKLQSTIKKLNKKSVQIQSELEAAVLLSLVVNTYPDIIAANNKNLKNVLSLFRSYIKSRITADTSSDELQEFFFSLVEKNPNAVMGEPMRQVILKLMEERQNHGNPVRTTPTQKK